MLVFRFGNDYRYGVTLQGSEARAINSSGQIVGWAEIRTGAIHAVLWTGEEEIDLGTLGGRNSCALGINYAGQVVGWAETIAGERHAVRWDDREPQDLGTFPGESSVAFAINDAGQAAGMAWPADNKLAAPMGRALFWDGDEMTDITAGVEAWGSGAYDVNAGGEVVGWIVPKEGQTHAFQWSNEGIKGLFVTGSSRTTANAIDDMGRAVGWAEYPDEEDRRHAILWVDGQPIDLSFPFQAGSDTPWAVAHDINREQDVAGAVRTMDGALHAIVWPAADEAMWDLGTLGGSKAEAYAINEAGEIVGWSVTTAGAPAAFRWHRGTMTELRTIPDEVGG
jgi:probable HAF family extracellular repeat protein